MTRDEMVERFNVLSSEDSCIRMVMVDIDRAMREMKNRRCEIESEASALKSRIAKLDADEALNARLSSMPVTTVKSKTGHVGIKRWIERVTPHMIFLLDESGRQERYNISSGRCGMYKIEDINAALAAWEARNDRR